MAAELIADPTISHTPEHDLESVFWVLLWVTLLYTKTDWDLYLRSSTLTEAMNPKVYTTGGGASKLHFIRDRDSIRGLITGESPGLYMLLRGIHGIFSKRYHERTVLQYWTKEKEFLDMSARMDEDVNADEAVSADEDEDEDVSTDKRADERMDDDDIARQSGEAGPDALYDAVLGVFNKVLKVKGKKRMWSKTDRAVRQPVLMPSETKSAAQSGPKRSRDMVEESFGIMLPPSTRQRG